MHPVKYVFVAGCKVWAVHHDDTHHLIALGDGEANAECVALGLAMLWHVPAKRLGDALDVDEVLYTPDAELPAETRHDYEPVDSPSQQDLDDWTAEGYRTGGGPSELPAAPLHVV